MKKEIIIGLDPGFGGIKYAHRVDGKLSLGKFPSILAKTKNKAPDLLHYKDNYYYVGEEATFQPKETILEVKDYANLKKEVPVFLAEVLHRLGIKSTQDHKVTVVTGLSLAHNEDGAAFKEVLSKFTINGQQFTIDVKLLPQGFGAMKTIEKAIEQNSDDFDKTDNFVIFDIGFNTLDVVIVIGGKARVDKLVGYEGRGVIAITERLRDHIKRSFGRDISIKEASSILDKGTYKLRGTTHNLNTVISDLKTEYTNDLMNFLEKNYANELDKYDTMYFVGGGAYMIDQNYSQNIKVVKKPEYYNAIGNLIFGEESASK